MDRWESSDLVRLARALKALAVICERYPEEMLELMNDRSHGPRSEQSAPSERAENTDLFRKAGMPAAELRSELSVFDLNDLKYLIRKFRLGAIKSRSRDILIEHIADQVSKRGIDVFTGHE
jgi:hypothetical protein